MAFLKKYSLLIKLILCSGIIYWLIQSGKLDLSKLSLFYKEPRIFIFHFSCWFLGFILFNSIRWKILLDSINVHLGILQAISITAIGLFFNSFLPGSVSGDGIKAYYVIKRNKQASKGALFFSVLFDRALAFYGLFMIATFSLIYSFSFEEIIEMRAVSFPIFSIFGAISTFLFSTYFISLETLFKFKIFKNQTTQKIFTMLYQYQKKPLLIIKVLFFAILTQGLFFLYFSYITRYFNDFNVNYNILILIYPLGLLITALPIAPAGIGVGHVAYDTLFTYFNLKDGANVFNLFFIGSLSFNLLGVIPYLLMKKEDTHSPKSKT